VQARRRLGHVPALDGVRGVAILLVLVSHIGWAPGGLMGVDVFFALSGFLITTLLLEERFRTGSVDLRAFYIRRARRLLPALFPVLLFTAFAYAELGEWHYLLYPVAVLFYVANFVRLAVGHPLPHGLGQMWSLAEEEQFYLLWPAVLLWLLRAKSPMRIARGLVGFAVAVMAWRAASWLFFGAQAHTILSPDTRSDALLLGCALAAGRFAGLRVRRAANVVGVLALVGIAVLAIAVDRGGAVDTALILALPVVSALSTLMLAAALEPGTWVSRLLTLWPLRMLGVVSYSVYLWHLAVFSVVTSAPLMLPAAILVGAGSYRWVERPFRRPSAGAQHIAAAVPAQVA
jgi:peptidoglycan/LPS O-acetylase OafA/YrhL